MNINYHFLSGGVKKKLFGGHQKAEPTPGTGATAGYRFSSSGNKKAVRMRRTAYIFLTIYFYAPMISIYKTNRRYPMQELLIMVGLVAGWYVLNRYILPRMGVAT
jgi:hypothetical protein